MTKDNFANEPDSSFDKSIRIFNSFEDAEENQRINMAKMTPEERLVQLQKIREISTKLKPGNKIKAPDKKSIHIKKGEQK